MVPGEKMSDAQQMATLASRVHALEAELAAARAGLSAEQARMLAMGEEKGEEKGEAPPAMEEKEGGEAVPFHALPLSNTSSLAASRSPVPFILLAPLPKHDALWRKWRLGAGLPPSDGRIPPAASESGLPALSRASGCLRLYGILPNGQRWEKSLSFADLSREGGVTIGRDGSVCDVILPEPSVSRRHALLELGEHGLSVTDLGASNGVYANDKLLEPYIPCCPLANGMTLGLGEVALGVEIASTPI